MVKPNQKGESATPKCKMVETVELIGSWDIGSSCSIPTHTQEVFLINGKHVVSITKRVKAIVEDGDIIDWETDDSGAEIKHLQTEIVTNEEILDIAEEILRSIPEQH